MDANRREFLWRAGEIGRGGVQTPEFRRGEAEERAGLVGWGIWRLGMSGLGVGEKRHSLNKLDYGLHGPGGFGMVRADEFRDFRESSQ